jgi:hypothetical protein
VLGVGNAAGNFVDGLIVSTLESCLAAPADVHRKEAVWVYAVGASDARAYYDDSVSNAGKRERCGCPCTALDKGSVNLLAPELAFLYPASNYRSIVAYCSTGHHTSSAPAVADGWLAGDVLWDRSGVLPSASGGYVQCEVDDSPFRCPPSTSTSSFSATPTPTPTPSASMVAVALRAGTSPTATASTNGGTGALQRQSLTGVGAGDHASAAVASASDASGIVDDASPVSGSGNVVSTAAGLSTTTTGSTVTLASASLSRRPASSRPPLWYAAAGGALVGMALVVLGVVVYDKRVSRRFGRPSST